MPSLSNRTDTFTESLIRKMTRISLENNAINLSQGFPDFDPPKVLMDRMTEVAYEDYHQYAITWGSQRMREALAKKHEHFTGTKLNPDTNILVTCGSTEAMMCAMMTVCNIGDKVIVFSPFYENYGADAILTGADPIYIPLNPPEFTFDPDVLEAAFKQHPKAIILCNPSNPCGKVFTLDELKIIADFAEKYDTFVITDEVYEHIVYEPNKHIYFANLPGMFERTITCSSLSKTYSITGWRLGYAAAPALILKQMLKIHQFAIMCAPTTSQYAAVDALRNGDEDIARMKKAYDERRRYLLREFRGLGMDCFEPYGAFYMFPCIKRFGMTSDEFANRLLQEEKLALVPGTAFGNCGEGYLRVSYAYSLEDLQKAIERIKRFVARLDGEKKC